MVEWKYLGEVCNDVIVPMRDRPKVFDGTIPWCRIEDIEGMYFNKSLSGLMVSEKIVKQMNLKVYPAGTVICSCSATLGVCAINTQPLITNQTFIGLICTEQIINRFLYYYMLTRKKELMSLSTTGTIPYVSREKFEKITIPIPSLEEQTRIVGILDTFTSAIDNLKEQIAQRRKQYEYYRDQLLDLEGKPGVEIKTLPEISDNRDRVRKPITSSKRKAGNYPYYGASGIVDYVDGYIFDGDYLLISEDGANLVARSTPIAFSITGKNWVNNHAHVLQFKDKATQKYVEIYLNMIDLEPWINGAAQPKLNQDNLNKISIPLPPLSEQQRIVSILDTFEASIQNLEAQLKERQKQYEYYRNKLLTFE